MKPIPSQSPLTPPDKQEKWKLAATLQKQFHNESLQNIALFPPVPESAAHDTALTDFSSQILEQATLAIIVVDDGDKVVMFNNAAEQLWGRDRDAVLGGGISSLMPPMKDGQSGRPPGHSTLEPLVGLNVELPIERPNHTRVWAEISVSCVKVPERTLHLIAARNVTLTKVHKTLRYQVLKAMAETDSLLEVMNQLCQEIKRIAPEISATIVRVDSDSRMHPLSAPDFPAEHARLLEGIELGAHTTSQAIAAYRGDSVLIRDIANDPGWIVGRQETLNLGYKSCWTVPIKGRDSRNIGVIAFYYRVCRSPNKLHAQLAEIAVSLCALAMERAASRARIHHLAFFDDLTDLPNRSLLHVQANQAIAQAARESQQLAVLFIDIDRFKQVNDSLGHPAGDTLLRVVAGRLREAIREVDILGRYSGDEFVIVLTQCDSVHATDLAGRLLAALSAPCRVGEVTLSPAASIGISLFPENGRDMETLIHQADMAMYQAKQKGRGCFSFFSGQLNQQAKERLTIEAALRQALSSNKLEIYYQPQVNIESHQLHGIEALLRWNDAAFGKIPPSRFIPLAEESGIIGSLSQWVLNEACRQLALWRQHGLQVPSVSVNLSPTDFHNLKLPQYLESILRSHGLSPGDLLVEITEGVLMDSNPSTMRTLHDIHALGVRLSIDDFGTGYSSLGYLRHLPVHELKLDQSFVRDLDRDRATRALTNAVMHIGDSMALTVIAEGVEHPTQRNLLKAQGYQIVQGFLFSPPLPPTALERWIDENLSFTQWE